MPQNPQEIAKLIVNGQEFTDWETVMVSNRWGEPFDIFMFTCAERTPLATRLALLQFKPGDIVQVELAGQLAITGWITTRQVAYEERTHAVQLIGKSFTSIMEKSSVRTQTGNFDGYTWPGIASAVAAQFGVQYVQVGSIDMTPYDQAQHNPGENAWDYLERLARMRGVVMGGNKFGNLVGIGTNTPPQVDTLIEGVNILRANCIISNDLLHQNYFGIAQASGQNDMVFGANAAQPQAQVPGIDPTPGSKLVIPIEEPGNADIVMKRTKWEQQWHDGTEVHANIVVQGWLTSGGLLWPAGAGVMVDAPMLILNEPLSIKTATFEQSTRDGSTTTLELVLPSLLNGLAFAGDDTGPSPTAIAPGAPFEQTNPPPLGAP